MKDSWFMRGKKCACGWLVLSTGATEDGGIVSDTSICRKCGNRVLIECSIKVTKEYDSVRRFFYTQEVLKSTTFEAFP